MIDPASRPLAVVVVGPPAASDLVPADPGIECRRAPAGRRESGTDSGRADVLIVDMDLDGPGPEAAGAGAAEIRRAFDPEFPVLILAVSRDPAHAAAALSAGARDFALLPRDRRWIGEAILRERDRRLRPASGSAAKGPEKSLDSLVVEIPSAGLPFEEYERRVIEHALTRAGWNRSRAARELEISRPRLLRKIERYGLEAPPRTPRQPPAE